MMNSRGLNDLRERLLAKRDELSGRLDRINANLRRPLDADSKERAVQIEDHEVVDALGNEGRTELKKVNDALQRMEAGRYGFCMSCAEKINVDRLLAYPYATDCIDCAVSDERLQLRS